MPDHTRVPHRAWARAQEERDGQVEKLRRCSRGVDTRDDHVTSQDANDRAERSHQLTRVTERGMRRFKSAWQAQRFLGVHAVYNLFNLGRHLISAEIFLIAATGRLHVLGKRSDCVTEADPGIDYAATADLMVWTRPLRLRLRMSQHEGFIHAQQKRTGPL